MSILAWHFLRPSRRLSVYDAEGQYLGDGESVRVGEWVDVAGPITPCVNGLHASVRAIDALEHCNWSGAVICRVEMDGEIKHHSDGKKLAASRRRVLWMAEADPVLWDWLCAVATKALQEHSPIAPAESWHAIDLRLAELAGLEIDLAAWDAALGHGRPRCTRTFAFVAAAWDAARAAAWAAARAAASAAASAAAWDAQSAELERLLLALPEAKP